jgi:endonuclease G
MTSSFASKISLHKKSSFCLIPIAVCMMLCSVGCAPKSDREGKRIDSPKAVQAQTERAPSAQPTPDEKTASQATSEQASSQPIAQSKDNAVGQVSAFVEGFESGTKNSYKSAVVRLQSGEWLFDDALIGNEEKDRKNGARAARLRELGKLTMLFDYPHGASRISIKHGVYGKDEGGNWSLWLSTNSGNSWKRIGSSIRTASQELQTATFDVSIVGNVRLEIRAELSEKSRINIDDVTIIPFGESAPQTKANPPPTTPTPATTPLGVEARIQKQIELGMPTGASPEYIIRRPQYVISYNRDLNVANWACWHVNAESYGPVPRYQGNFLTDNTLPTGFYRVTHQDYTGSGYDRGHIVRSQERTSTREDNDATFYLTNILPQTPDLNQGVWNSFELYCEKLAKQQKELYLIAGGTFDKNPPRLKGKVAVPKSTWKIVVVLERGQGLKDITKATRVIAVDMPNISGIRDDDWRKYRVSVKELEQRTGLKFLTAVPEEIRKALIEKVDNE